MKRVNKIISHPEYKKCLAEIKDFEKDRVYCKHDMEHFLSVSRLMLIYCYENNIRYDIEIIYAAGLLHDIGRAAEYKTGVSHETEGVKIARKILTDCGFKQYEQDIIIQSIINHRKSESDQVLAKILYLADKKSRNCFLCESFDTCRWDDSKKNHLITR